MQNIKNICLLLFVLLSFYGSAQTLSTKDYLAKYPGEAAVYLVKRQTFKMDLIKDTLNLSAEHYDECFYLNGTAKNRSEDKIYSGTLNPVSNIRAETKSLDEKGKYKLYPVKQFSLSPSFSSGVFYDDMKEYKFVYPQLQEGSITKLSYTTNYLLPQLISPYNFAAEYPCDASELVLICNNTIEFDTLLYNVSPNQIEYTHIKKGNYTTHTWRMKNLPAMVFEGRSVNIGYYSPQIFIKVNKINTPNGNRIYFENQQGLYNWLYTFVDKAQNEKDASIKQLSDSLKTVSKTDYELSKNIFYWVQDHVNYVAFEDGYGGFVPRAASEVYKKRYGDCKDMANLISVIHKSAGLDAHIAWIGTRDIAYKITAMPSPCNFNHMIAEVNINDSTYFLDATGKYQPFGFPTDHIQGKQALISLTDKTYKIVEVPILPKERNRVYDSVQCALTDMRLKGTGYRTVAGYPKIDFTYRYVNAHKEEKIQYLNNYLKFGNNKCSISNASVKNIENRDAKLIFKYDYELPDYVVSYQDEIFVNLHLFKMFTADIVDTLTRKLDFIQDNTTLLDEVIVFEIPAGYTVKNIPLNKSFSYGKAGFDFVYEKSGKVITLKKSIFMNSLLLEKKDFKEWNKMISEMNKSYKENITLKKNK
jgi:hypothetical protein